MGVATSVCCPFCAQENPEQALVCGSCARDVKVPFSLIVERDDLIQKRDKMRDELSKAKAQVAAFKRRRTGRSVERDENGM